MEQCVTKVWFNEHDIFVLFKDGREINASLGLFPRLKHATDSQRNHYELWNDGKWIHWEEIDEDLSAEGFLKHLKQPIAKK